MLAFRSIMILSEPAALTVTSSGTTVGTIAMIGKYATADFHLTSGASGSGTIITDPGVIHGGSVHSANVALLGNYIASFAAVGDAGIVVTSTGQTEALPPLLVHPHR